MQGMSWDDNMCIFIVSWKVFLLFNVPIMWYVKEEEHIKL